VNPLYHRRSPQLISHTGNELCKDLRKWIAPPDPSVNYNAASGAHHEGTAAWCTEGNTLANWKTSGSLLWIHGKRTYPIPVLVLFNHAWFYSWLWEEYSQVCDFLLRHVQIELI
jgi:hypothetical protein